MPLTTLDTDLSVEELAEMDRIFTQFNSDVSYEQLKQLCDDLASAS